MKYYILNKPNTLEHEIIDQSIHLKYLKFGMVNGKYIVSLIDLSGYDIVKGYGNSPIEAINDMHRGLI